MKELAEFIREHSREPWLPARPGAEVPEWAARRDVQAAFTVVGRRVRSATSGPSTSPARSSIARTLTGATSTARTSLARSSPRPSSPRGPHRRGAPPARTSAPRCSASRSSSTGAKLARRRYTRNTVLGHAVLAAHEPSRRKRLTHAYLRADAVSSPARTFAGAKLTQHDLDGTNLAGADLLRGAKAPRRRGPHAARTVAATDLDRHGPHRHGARRRRTLTGADLTGATSPARTSPARTSPAPDGQEGARFRTAG